MNVLYIVLFSMTVPFVWITFGSLWVLLWNHARTSSLASVDLNDDIEVEDASWCATLWPIVFIVWSMNWTWFLTGWFWRLLALIPRGLSRLPKFVARKRVKLPKATIVSLVLLLAACGPDQMPDHFIGVPDGPPPSCMWSRLNHTSGECIASGQRLRCYRSWMEDRVAKKVWWQVSCKPYRVFR